MADEVPILTNHASATKSPVPACTGLGVSIIPAFHYSNPASRPGAGAGRGRGRFLQNKANLREGRVTQPLLMKGVTMTKSRWRGRENKANLGGVSSLKVEV